MWFDNLPDLLASDEVRRIRVINKPVEAGERVLGSVPENLIPMLQLAALYRLTAENLDQQADSLRLLRKDKEFRLRCQANTSRAMIEALRQIIHCCVLEHFASVGARGGEHMMLLARKYEVREGWVIVLDQA